MMHPDDDGLLATATALPSRLDANAFHRARARELWNAAARYWAAEAEIVRAYFARHRTPERDLLWLRAQAFKETFDVRVLPATLQEEAWATGTVAVHPDGPDAVAKVAVELTHFRMIAELIEMLSGEPVHVAALPCLPEEERLQALRAPHRAGTPFQCAVINFTEGGGGVMYRILAQLDGDAFERMIATRFHRIYQDEVAHGPAQIREVARLACGADDWSLATRIVRDVGRQRLKMRDEMFSHPIGADRLAEFEAGDIDPWPLPMPF